MVRWPGKVPTDRPIDGVDASPLLLGQSQASGRDSYLFFGSDGEPMSINWRNFKMVHRYCEGIDQPIVTPFLPMFFDLWSDPQERYNLTNFRFDFDFMFHVLLKIGIGFELNTVKGCADWPISLKRPWVTRPSHPRKHAVKHQSLRNRVEHAQCTGLSQELNGIEGRRTGPNPGRPRGDRPRDRSLD